MGVLPGGEFGVYLDGSEGPSLRVFDEGGEPLAERAVPTMGGTPECGSVATDPSGGWWLTALHSPTDAADAYASIHRLPSRDAAFTSASVSAEGGLALTTVVAVPGGVVAGGASFVDAGFAAVSVTLGPNLDESARWVSDQLGQLVHLEQQDGVLVGLATEPSVDHTDAFLVGFGDRVGPPSWIQQVGTLGGTRDVVSGVDVTRNSILLFKTSREAVPGSEPPTPGDPSTVPPQRSRSVVEARDSRGELSWTHSVVDDRVDMASLGADEHVVLAWRGGFAPPDDFGPLVLSEFEALSSGGDRLCALECPIPGRILDIAELRGAPAGSFIATSEFEGTFELTGVRVRQP